MDALKLLCEPSYDNYRCNKGTFSNQWERHNSEDAKTYIVKFCKQSIGQEELIQLKDDSTIYNTCLKAMADCKASNAKLPDLKDKLTKSQGTLKIFASLMSAVAVGSLIFTISRFRSFIKEPEKVGALRFVASYLVGNVGIVSSSMFAFRAFEISSKEYLDNIASEIELFNKVSSDCTLETINTWLGVEK
ncbi:MAG: hypothetical protein JSR80_02415 [Verrucomicrobia bacterium]|nr:hypothetical protein [Verrucomicrobiota bacterium]